MPTPETKEPVLNLTGHKNGVFNVTFSPDGKYLATASKDHSVKLWDAATGDEIRTYRGHTGTVYSVCFSPDGKRLASASEDRTIRIWDAGSEKELLRLEEHTSDVYQVVFSPDGKRLASGGSDKFVILWDAASGKVLHKFKGHTNRVVTVSFSPDGKRLASACGTSAGNGTTDSGGEVKLWDTATGMEILSLPPATSKGVLTIAFSPDGKRLAGACLDSKVRVWEAATGQESLALAGHTLDVYHVVFSPDGRFLASSSAKWNREDPGEIKLWDLATAKGVTSFTGHTMTIWSLAFSPDGKRLASASGKWNKEPPGEVRVWDVSEVVKAQEAGPAPDAKQLAALWTDLSGKDAAKAYRAVWELSASPKETLAFLKERVKAPPRNLALARIPKLIEALDDDSFEVRQKASEELAKLGTAAHAALQKARTSPSAEVRRRVEELLEKKGTPPPPMTDEEVLAWRTVEVLQHLGNAEARALLEKLAKDAGDTPLGQDAAAAAVRLSTERRSPR
jgi:WD40 repeat protein